MHIVQADKMQQQIDNHVVPQKLSHSDYEILDTKEHTAKLAW